MATLFVLTLCTVWTLVQVSWHAGGQSPRTRRLASSWATIHLSPSDALLGGGVTGSFSRAQGAPRHHQTPGRATRTSMWWKSGSHHPSMRISMIGSFRELPPTVRGRGQPLSLGREKVHRSLGHKK